MNPYHSHQALASVVEMYKGILEDQDRIQKLQMGEAERLRKSLDVAEKMRREQVTKAFEAQAEVQSLRELIAMVVNGVAQTKAGIGKGKPWTLDEILETLRPALVPSPDAVRQQEATPMDARDRPGDGGSVGEAHAEGQRTAGGSEEAGAVQAGEVGAPQQPTFVVAPGREVPARFRTNVPIIGKTDLTRPPAGTTTVERLTGFNRQG